MKIKHLFGIVLLLLGAIGFVSCNDEDENSTPITLAYENPQIIFDNERRSLTLTPFSSETTPLYIKGGDGVYSMVNSDGDVVETNFDGKKISFKPLKIGNASIRIEDPSSRQYILSITVKYREEQCAVYKRKYIIQGDNMTVGDKAKLEKEIEASDTIVGYRFVYKDAENSKGTLYIHDKNNREKESDFEKERIRLDEENAIVIAEKIRLNQYWRVSVKETGEIFYITPNFYPLIETKSDYAVPSYCYIKDLTEHYKTAYPAMEHAYIVYEMVGKK